MTNIRKDSQSAYEITKEFTHNGIDFKYEFKLYTEDEFDPYHPCFHTLDFKFMGIRFVVHKNFNSSREYLLSWVENMMHNIMLYGLFHLTHWIDSGEIKFSRISFMPSFFKNENGYHIISINLK